MLCYVVTGFESQQGQEFSLLHNDQTASGSYPASYAVGTMGKAAGA
jgi:hypothetical protein